MNRNTTRIVSAALSSRHHARRVGWHRHGRRHAVGCLPGDARLAPGARGRPRAPVSVATAKSSAARTPVAPVSSTGVTSTPNRVQTSATAVRQVRSHRLDAPQMARLRVSAAQHDSHSSSGGVSATTSSFCLTRNSGAIPSAEPPGERRRKPLAHRSTAAPAPRAAVRLPPPAHRRALGQRVVDREPRRRASQIERAVAATWRQRSAR